VVCAPGHGGRRGQEAVRHVERHTAGLLHLSHQHLLQVVEFFGQQRFGRATHQAAIPE